MSVLILTTFEPDEYVYLALRSGASRFVLTARVAGGEGLPLPGAVMHRTLALVS